MLSDGATQRRQGGGEGKSAIFVRATREERGAADAEVATILDKLAAEAGKYSGGGIEIYPHMLRHTYGSKIMAKTSSESQTAEFLGHSSTKYTGMYIGLTKQEREDLLDED
ncbi:MAG: tyrosine-type recombinase/integrase [Kofleriaceae bacterium]|nr:tyrosine-type recombinase/integrase [Kofleriaceae bacterium]